MAIHIQTILIVPRAALSLLGIAALTIGAIILLVGPLLLPEQSRPPPALWFRPPQKSPVSQIPIATARCGSVTFSGLPTERSRFGRHAR